MAPHNLGAKGRVDIKDWKKQTRMAIIQLISCHKIIIINFFNF